MAEQDDREEGGTYRALPRITEDVAKFILADKAGLVSEFAGSLKNLTVALRRVDEEMEGLSKANPGLATVVAGAVEGLYGVFSQTVGSEQNRAYLRAIAYINAFVLLRALDLQWRALNTQRPSRKRRT